MGRQSRPISKYTSKKNASLAPNSARGQQSQPRITKPDYNRLRQTYQLEEIGLDMVDTEKELREFAKDIQNEYWRVIESDENPKELQGENMKTVLEDLEKFKKLYEEEVKLSNVKLLKY